MQPSQRSEDWFADRLGKATASRFSDVMTKIKSGEAAARRNYRAELVIERIIGLPNESYFSKDMEWGVNNEALARIEYMMASGNVAEECYFFKHDKLEAGASPDGLVGDDGCLEIKCPKSATHIQTLITQALPAEYFPQVQGQLWMTGRKWADFVSFDPRLPANAQLFITRVERDEAYITALEAEVALFLKEVDEEVEFIKSYGGGSKHAKS